MPLHVISAKLDEYIAAKLLEPQDKEARERIFEEMEKVHRVQNPLVQERDAQAPVSYTHLTLPTKA